MKKTSFLFSVFIIVFFLLLSSFLNAQIVGLQWNTFHGSSADDLGLDIAVSGSGNVYVAGYCHGSWGSPVNAHSGAMDAIVLCLDSSGNLLWHTFLGSYNNDYINKIILDGSGNVYVVGYSDVGWGSPVNPYSGGGEAFVAYLNSSGTLLWHTFLGSSYTDYGRGIVIDSSSNVYVTGWSNSSWGTPLNSHSGHGNNDMFVACLNSAGSLQWSTFYGTTYSDQGLDITRGNSGNLYVVGISASSWGTPLNSHTGGLVEDIFVACLNSSGSLQWNTFWGSTGVDYGYCISLDSSGKIYIGGESDATWGSPVNAHSGNNDGFAACLNNSGGLIWNTFVGCSDNDRLRDIVLDSTDHPYISGDSPATWGSPRGDVSHDVYLACLDKSGNLIWNTFIGDSAGDDNGCGIALDGQGNIYQTGKSDATWGSPINTINTGDDIFIAKLFTNPTPIPDIIANGSGGPISITQSDSLQIRVSLDPFGLTADVDYWLAYKGPSGWGHYNNSTKKWESGLGVTHQGPLMDLNNKKVYQKSGLTPGNYTFYFGVDMNMDGNLTKSELFYDQVKVTVIL